LAPMNEASLSNQPIMGQHKCRLRPVSMEAPEIHLAVSNQNLARTGFDYCSLQCKKDPGIPVHI